MPDLLTAEEMREIERSAIESGSVTGAALMERAGRGAVEAMLDHWPDWRDTPGKAGILCGPGNNGGDGFVMGAALAERGWTVDTYFYGDLERQPRDAHDAMVRCEEAGGTVSPIDLHRGRQLQIVSQPRTVWIDALFGIGLSRPLPPAISMLLQLLDHERNRRGGALVAVDILSGLHADTGRMIVSEGRTPHPLHADLTVTFHAMKHGHVAGEGAARSGTVAVVGLGL